jgi:hypothetical protein
LTLSASRQYNFRPWPTRFPESRGQTAARNPSNERIAACLGFNDSIERTHTRDVVIVGAGPSSLAAAVYGASEGLDVLRHVFAMMGAVPNRLARRLRHAGRGRLHQVRP